MQSNGSQAYDAGMHERRTGMRRMLFAIAVLLLIATPVFAVWSQKVVVSARSENGLPVEGAQVKIVYQKDDSLKSGDGLVSGFTGADGRFETELVNIVPFEYHNRNFEATLSTFYWKGEMQRTLADSLEAKTLEFFVPVAIEPVNVTVYDATNAPIEGAGVGFAGFEYAKITDRRGRAGVQVPKGGSFEGIASYGNASAAFSEKDVRISKSGKAILVALPLTLESSEEKNAIIFLLNLKDEQNEPVEGQEISVAFSSENATARNYTAKTDAAGRLKFGSNEEGALALFFMRNENEYYYEYNLTGSKNVSVKFAPLLTVAPLAREKDGENCFRIIANVSDPRSHLPIDVKMVKVGQETTPLDVSVDERGLFVSRLCVSADVQVQAIASNKFDNVVSAPLDIKYSKPYVPPPPKPPAEEKEKPTELLVWAILAFVIVSILSVIFYIVTRREFAGAPGYVVERTLRPVIIYVRKLVQLFTRRRGKPPLARAPPPPNMTQQP